MAAGTLRGKIFLILLALDFAILGAFLFFNWDAFTTAGHSKDISGLWWLLLLAFSTFPLAVVAFIVLRVSTPPPLITAVALAALSYVACGYFANDAAKSITTGFSQGELNIIPGIVFVFAYFGL